MKASELILLLQKIIDEHGDLPVYYWDEYEYREVEKAEYSEAKKADLFVDPLPERIELS